MKARDQRKNPWLMISLRYLSTSSKVILTQVGSSQHWNWDRREIFSFLLRDFLQTAYQTQLHPGVHGQEPPAVPGAQERKSEISCWVQQLQGTNISSSSSSSSSSTSCTNPASDCPRDPWWIQAYHQPAPAGVVQQELHRVPASTAAPSRQKQSPQVRCEETGSDLCSRGAENLRWAPTGSPNSFSRGRESP